MENKELKKRFIDERTGIEYILVNDFYIPNLIPPTPIRTESLGKYGRMRARYLRENKKAEYSIMMIDNTLQNHLIEVDKTAKERFDLLMKQFILLEQFILINIKIQKVFLFQRKKGI